MTKDLIGFPFEEADTISKVYVCAQCEGELRVIPVDWTVTFEDNSGFYVVCPDCGNVEQVGRISKTTVAIRNEQGLFQFRDYCCTLPDLWGDKLYCSNRTPLKEGETRREANLRELGF